ncbi:hypothetical protein BURCENBC7_AP3786 [Burkholderia cenocepacia BC7]|nr:hypothetical protein BURCENK562V_C2499 [Burkholderia cenocepacia K56-2Valvano]ERI32100.1 hypothetical protein BURCENBC7_AP3786 [Burkholderia cenocepacia BC7]
MGNCTAIVAKKYIFVASTVLFVALCIDGVAIDEVEAWAAAGGVKAD